MKSNHDNTYLLKSEIPQIEKAIKNGWSLRPIRNGYFNNIDNQKGTRLNDVNHILTSVEDLNKFPNGTTALAMIPNFLDNFVCLDFDSKIESLNVAVWSVLTDFYKHDDLFMRTGNPLKLGQFWFKYDGSFAIDLKVPDLDIITKSKRLDTIGIYKDTKLRYKWRYKNPFDNKPSDLLDLSSECFHKIIELYEIEYGVEEKTASIEVGRHDYLNNLVYKRIMKGEHPIEVFQAVLESSEFNEICSDGSRSSPEVARQEVIRLFPNAVADYLKKGEFENLEEIVHPISEFSKNSPEVETGSFIDVLYEAAKRNQFTDAKQMAFFSCLSLVSWLLSFKCKWNRTRTNLMILYVAESGSGKSTSTRIIKEVLNMFPTLDQSFGDGVIKTREAFFNSFQRSPIQYYMIDEYTKLLKGTTAGNSHTQGLLESICQYYNDFKDTDFQKIQLKSETYGMCYGPKFNGLFFTTPQMRSSFKKEDFLGGMGRRTLMVIDSELHLSKIDHDPSREFFTTEEKQKIYDFVSSFVLSDEDILSNDIYNKKDISFMKIKKPTTKKGENPNYQHALQPKTDHELKADNETRMYLMREHVEKSNDFKKQAMKTNKESNKVIVNSFSEFTEKLAMIHTLAGKKEPSLIIKRDSVEWAEKMFEFYMKENLTDDIDEMIEDNQASKTTVMANEFLKILSERNEKQFSFSTDTCRNYFNRSKKIHREPVLQNLIANDKIKLINIKAAKRGRVYEII